MSQQDLLTQRYTLAKALGEAIIQAQADALKLGNSAHGRHLQKLADTWTIAFNKGTAGMAYPPPTRGPSSAPATPAT